MKTEELERGDNEKLETRRQEMASGGVRSQSRSAEEKDLTSEEMEDLSGGSTDTGNSFRIINPTPDVIDPIPNLRRR